MKRSKQICSEEREYMRKALGIIGVITMLTGCAMAETPTKLMEAPTHENWQNELQEQIKKDLPVNSRLITPLSNQDKQTIWTVDVNQHGKKEAVILYKQQNEDYHVYMSVYKQSKKGWEVQATRTFTGEGVDTVSIGDFTGNHKQDILIGISLSHKESQNEVIVFSTEENDLVERYKRNYTKLFVEDLNDNGIKDISVVTYAKDEQLQVELLEKFKTLSEISFDPYVNGIQKVQLGRISLQTKAMVIDAAVGAHSGMTYVAKFEKDHWEKMFEDEENQLFNGSVMESQDINGDGIIEFATKIEPKGWEESAYAEIPWFERYVQWDEKNGFKPVQERYVNVEQGYYVNIPADLIGNITIAKTDAKDAQHFIYGDTNKTWLEVHTFKRTEWKDVKEYDAVVKTNSYIYAVPNQSKYKKFKSYIKPLADYQQE